MRVPADAARARHRVVWRLGARVFSVGARVVVANPGAGDPGQVFDDGVAVLLRVAGDVWAVECGQAVGPQRGRPRRAFVIAHHALDDRVDPAVADDRRARVDGAVRIDAFVTARLGHGQR